MTLEEELAFLRAENRGLRQQLAQALEQLAAAQKVISELEKRNADLEAHRTDPPSFVKPNRPKSEGPKQPRKKRAAEHNHSRPRETPTRIVRHALERCPECDHLLRGETVHYRRQVIEIPEAPPVEVREYEVIKRRCPVCGQWRSPKLDLRGQVLGQGRMGVRLVSLIAHLRQSLRMPVEGVQEHLRTMFGLSISKGEIVEVLHRVRKATEGAVAGLKREMRASGVVHADETGWRENGRNGYIWGFFTPGGEGVRYYEYDRSRAGAVAKRILGAKVKGHLVSDFYVGYNDIAGEHQRCWPHLLRDLHDLKEEHGGEEGVEAWAKAVRALHDEAQEWLKVARAPTREEREKEYVLLVGRAHQLGLEHAQEKGHPCQALARRILRHEHELFQFVLVEGLSADNNLAERSLRPLVVIRKISGGSRSEEGSKTRMALATLFETWKARGLNPFTECLNLLSQLPAPSS